MFCRLDKNSNSIVMPFVNAFSHFVNIVFTKPLGLQCLQKFCSTKYLCSTVYRCLNKACILLKSAFNKTCMVVCVTLIGAGAVGSGRNYFGLSDEVPILKNPMCTGRESSLTECPGYLLGEASGYYCETGQFQAGASCVRDNNLQCRDGEVRLGDETKGRTTEGLDFVGGRVEVCESGVFGAVCDIGWSKDAAQGICNLLDFSDRGVIIS